MHALASSRRGRLKQKLKKFKAEFPTKLRNASHGLALELERLMMNQVTLYALL